MNITKESDCMKSTGTSFHFCTVSVTPKQIEAVHGKGRTDGFKSVWDWTFTDDKENPFTVYDWKETSMYSSDRPDPEDLADSAIDFHIGSKTPELEIQFRDAFLKTLNL